MLGWTITFDVLKSGETTYEKWSYNAEQSHLMYWNMQLPKNIIRTCRAEQSHLMYWNDNKETKGNAHYNAEQSHLMYWNLFSIPSNVLYILLNNHIWCIEIHNSKYPFAIFTCWTITFDVLKWCKPIVLIHYGKCWTITFDVLKWLSGIRMNQQSVSWTITFDVLK